MPAKLIQKQAAIVFGGLVLYSIIYPFLGFTYSLRFSFFEPELMTATEITGGQTNLAMRWAHFLIWLPVNIAGFYACMAAVYASHLARKGAFFTPSFATALRHVGTAVFLSALFDIVATTLVPYILSALNPVGRVPISLSLTPEELALILCGIGFYSLGNMMAEATRVAEENKGFV